MGSAPREKVDQGKIANKAPTLWLPALIIGIGILTGAALWYSLYFNFEVYFHTLKTLKDHLPWIGMAFIFSLSVLFAIIMRTALLAKYRAIELDNINHELLNQIAEKTSAQEAKQELEIALLQGQKLQAIGTLAGGIAHDFNNILYAVIGYTEISREDAPKDGLLYKNLGKVLEAAKRGQELVARILAFGRRQHHQFDAISLKATIEAVLSLLKPTIPSSVIIEFQIDRDYAILGNQTQIHQVLVNLINNAVDAMDSEGVITINVSEVSTDDPLLQKLPEAKNVTYCKIMINDTGHGMDQLTMDRIFEPFYTTKEVGRGTGLGLSIVHSIIKEHQGNITVTSQPGHGTTFTILLPENK